MYPLQKCLQQTVFNELSFRISLPRSIKKKNITKRNAVYFRLCIDLMHILPPVTAEGFDGSHHPRFAEWKHMCVTDRHDMTIAVRVALNPNTTNQPIFVKLGIVECKLFHFGKVGKV